MSGKDSDEIGGHPRHAGGFAVLEIATPEETVGVAPLGSASGKLTPSDHLGSPTMTMCASPKY